MLNKHKQGGSLSSKVLADSTSQNKLNQSPLLGNHQSQYGSEKSISNGEERNQKIFSVYCKQGNAKKMTSQMNSSNKEGEFDKSISRNTEFKLGNNQGANASTNAVNERRKNFIIVKENGIFPRVQRVMEDPKVTKQNNSNLNEVSQQKAPISLMSSPYGKNIQDFKKMKTMQQQNIQKINDKIEKLIVMQDNLKKGNIDFLNNPNNQSTQKPNNIIVPVNSEKAEKLEKHSIQSFLPLQQQLQQNVQISNQLQSLQIQQQQQQLVSQQPPIQPIQVYKKSPTEIIKPYLSKQNLKIQINRQKAAMLINHLNQLENNRLKCQSSNYFAAPAPKDNYLIQLQRDLEKEEINHQNKIPQISSLTKIQNYQKLQQEPKENTSNDKKETIILTYEETKLYGQRCPEGYDKIEILGKGGFSVVWLCKNKLTNQKVAAKQMVNKKNQESVQRELQFLQNFYNDNGTPKPQFYNDQRLKNMIGLVGIQKDQKDTWIIYELGGTTVTKLFYNLRGDFHNGERVYKINLNQAYYKFMEINKNNLMKDFIRKNALALSFLVDNKLVHCDIKPENILVALKKVDNDLALEQVNIIDFGSSLSCNEKGSINLITPEYMPPEVINSFINELHHTNNNSNLTMIEQLQAQNHMDVIDVWSFGASLLEILTGFPQWLSYKCRVQYNQKSVVKTGLFCIRNQDYEKLFQKQKAISDLLPQYLINILPMFDNQDQGELLIDLVAQMLKFNPNERIKPKDILKHPFLCDTCSDQAVEQCRMNVFEMFNKNSNGSSTNIVNNNENPNYKNLLKSSKVDISPSKILPLLINGNKSRSQSLETTSDPKRYHYDKSFLIKNQQYNNYKDICLKQKERNKSSILMVSDPQLKNYESSLLSPNISVQEIDTFNLQSVNQTPEKQTHK